MFLSLIPRDPAETKKRGDVPTSSRVFYIYTLATVDCYSRVYMLEFETGLFTLLALFVFD